MARKSVPKRQPRKRPAPSRAKMPRTRAPRIDANESPRARIIGAFMGLLAENPFEQIELAEVASRADVSLSELRDEFGSLMGIVGAHIKEIDRVVLDGVDPDLAEEPARERLFDVLMRRLEVLTPHRAALRSLSRSAMCNPGLAFAFNGLAVRSQRWMLTAADIDSSGPKGFLRAQGLALLFACVLRTFIDDDDPNLSRTMAALDKELERGQRWSGFLDDVCSIPKNVLRRGGRRRRGREEAAAA
jgi:AcrR family transcriptional regulator